MSGPATEVERPAGLVCLHHRAKTLQVLPLRMHGAGEVGGGAGAELMGGQSVLFHGGAPRRCSDEGVKDGAGNALAADLFLGWQAQPAASADSQPPNLLRFLFFNPQARELIENWPVRAQRLVAEFRADCGGRLQTPLLRALIDELSALSPEFDALWQLNDVQEREGGERGFVHPRHGRLVYEQLTLRAALHPEYKLVMLLPLAVPE